MPAAVIDGVRLTGASALGLRLLRKASRPFGDPRDHRVTLGVTDHLDPGAVRRVGRTKVKVVCGLVRKADGHGGVGCGSKARRGPRVERTVGQVDVRAGGHVKAVKLGGRPVVAELNVKLLAARLDLLGHVERRLRMPHAPLREVRHQKDLGARKVGPAVTASKGRVVLGNVEAGAGRQRPVHRLDSLGKAFDGAGSVCNDAARLVDRKRGQVDAVVGGVRVVEHCHGDQGRLHVLEQGHGLVGRLDRVARLVDGRQLLPAGIGVAHLDHLGLCLANEGVAPFSGGREGLLTRVHKGVGRDVRADKGDGCGRRKRARNNVRVLHAEPQAEHTAKRSTVRNDGARLGNGTVALERLNEVSIVAKGLVRG
mmetsp:Transcript_15336/g.47907  ORF Transcript_15336/g.47907 Transcript_15336/m.47907 type:complete len:368 (+) Transcript_15336:1650-2753(+)